MRTFNCIVGILAIVGLELFAISKGIDGKVLTISISTIAFIVGYNFKKK